MELSHPPAPWQVCSPGENGGAAASMLRGGKVKQIYELHGQGLSVRRIAKILGLSRNSVRKYLRSPGLPQPKPRAPRKSPASAKVAAKPKPRAKPARKAR